MNDQYWWAWSDGFKNDITALARRFGHYWWHLQAILIVWTKAHYKNNIEHYFDISALELFPALNQSLVFPLPQSFVPGSTWIVINCFWLGLAMLYSPAQPHSHHYFVPPPVHFH